MSDRPNENKLNLFLAALLALFVFFFLYNFRHVDDNSLTSWQIVFGHFDLINILPLLVVAVMLSYVLSEHPLPRPAFLAVMSFAAGTLFWREPEVLVDTARYFTQAKHLELYGVGYFLREWGGGIVEWTDLPLVPFIDGLVFKVFGEARIFILILNTSMYSLTVLLTYLIGRDLWGRETGLTAGLLVMAMPYLYTQVPLMIVDVPSMFFLTLMIYGFQRALREGGMAGIVLAALAFSATVLSKYSLWVMLSVLAVIWGVILSGAEKGSWFRITARGAAAVILGMVIPAAFFLYKFDVVSRQIHFLFEYQKPGLERWTESFKSTFLFQVHPFVTVAAIYSVLAAISRRDLKYPVVLWLVALMLVMGVRRSRYLIPVFPMLALMASYGLRELEDARLRRLVVYLAVTTSLVLSAFAFVPYLRTNVISNLMYAGNYLDTMNGDEVRVYTLPQGDVLNPAVSVPILDLYTHKRVSYSYEIEKTPGEDEIATSSLRFTWDYVNPPYYYSAIELPPVVVIIGPGENSEFNEKLSDYSLHKRFDVSEGLYQYKPFVNVYVGSEINN